jgi:hypothetical protein
MSSYASRPRILFIIPEAVFIPQTGGSGENTISANAYGFGDFPVALISHLHHFNVDVYVAQPDYRRSLEIAARSETIHSGVKLPGDHLYLAKDRAFYYANLVDLNPEWENIKISIAFQREVINQIIPRVRPDLIHCYNWMTGLIPAAAKKLAIPCLFTVQELFYECYPGSYEQTRDINPLDLLLSGILSASHVVIDRSAQLPTSADRPGHIDDSILRKVLGQKYHAGCASSHFDLAHPPSHPAIKRKSLHAGQHFDQRAEQQKNRPLRGQSIPPLDYRAPNRFYRDLYEILLQRPLSSPDKKRVYTQQIEHRAYESPFIAPPAGPMEPLFSL